MKCFCGKSILNTICNGEINCCSDFFEANVVAYLDSSNFESLKNSSICITFSTDEMYSIYYKSYYKVIALDLVSNKMIRNNLKEFDITNFDITNNIEEYQSTIIECFNCIKRARSLRSFK